MESLWACRALSARLALYLWRNIKARPTKQRRATPPMTPPTIAPVLLVEELEAAVLLVGVVVSEVEERDVEGDDLDFEELCKEVDGGETAVEDAAGVGVLELGEVDDSNNFVVVANKCSVNGVGPQAM
jgi:hypothetical protein